MEKYVTALLMAMLAAITLLLAAVLVMVIAGIIMYLFGCAPKRKHAGLAAVMVFFTISAGTVFIVFAVFIALCIRQ